MLQAFPGLSAERKNPRPTPPPASTAVRHGYSSFASASRARAHVAGVPGVLAGKGARSMALFSRGFEAATVLG